MQIDVQDLIDFCNKEIQDTVQRDIMHHEILTYLFDTQDKILNLESENKTLKNKLSQLTNGKY